MKLLVVLSGAPLPLLLAVGLISSIALFALYLLRERHRPLVVPFVDLWRRTIDQRRSSVPWHRLRRLLSLLLQLILLGLVLLALADPRSDAASLPGRTVVFLVDVSPSMTALVDEQSSKTRLDEAKERLVKWVGQLGDQDRALLLSLSARPEVETAWTNDRRRLERGIAALKPKDSAVDLPRALGLARDVLPPHSEAEVILVGDGAYPPLLEESTAGLKLSFEPVLFAPPPGALENVGISNFSARRYPDQPRHFEAQLEVSSTAPRSAEVELTIRSIDASFRPGPTIEVKRTLLPADGRLIVPLAELSGASEGVVAELRRVDGGPDFLAADNHAQLLLRPLPPLRVLVLGAPNQFLDAALLAEPGLEISRDEQRPADVVIYDGVSSLRHPGTAALYLGVPAGDGNFPLGLGHELELFGFDRWQRDSALFASVDPYDVQVLEGHALVSAPGDIALAFSGQDPIVVMGQRNGGRFVALGFNPRRSDFFLRAAWPLFLHNTLRELAPFASGEDGIAVVPGRSWHLRTPTPDRTARIRGPLGLATSLDRRVAVTEQRTTVFGELAGFYEIEQGERRARFFANYFDEAEVRLVPGPKVEVANPAAAAHAAKALPRPRPFRGKRETSPWLTLLALALLLSLSEWWSYHRRWTV